MSWAKLTKVAMLAAIATVALPAKSTATNSSLELQTEPASVSVVAAPCSEIGSPQSLMDGPADPAQGPVTPVDDECLLTIEVLEPLPSGLQCIIWELWCEIDGVIYWWGQNLLCEEES